MNTTARLWLCCLYLQAISSPVFSSDWEAEVVPKIKALTSSCVVIPCTFTHPGHEMSTSRLRGVWHEKDNWNNKIYYEDQTKVVDNFKGRTKLVGQLGKANCSLEIDEIKDHDNGPYCFRIEIDSMDKFSFVEQCVIISMMAEPQPPKLTYLKDCEEGTPFPIICSVTHTCPSYVPKLSWKDVPDKQVIVSHKDNSHGNWETESILTITPTEDDDHREITCMASFHGGKTSETSFTLNVKRKANMLHIIIPVTAAVGTAVIFGGLCILMRKKYMRRIQDLQSRGDNGTRPDDYNGGPPRPEKRRSIWSRFSRREPCNSADTSVGYRANNVTAGGADMKVSKPRCPSPKSTQKSANVKSVNSYECGGNDIYTNTADLNVYGNL
ncbi:myelin-associated glycoprotein-like [Megalops cyprinoides]|uniref:myelin-associated glycoprotein-like n=1 Tax=Megalops cyprinoides TaxID=118141 RepID=UPI001864F522|nr:myelin-associated glycoprotein-like [Megalops cyprinoides]